LAGLFVIEAAAAIGCECCDVSVIIFEYFCMTEAAKQPAVASLPQVAVSSNPQRGRVAQLAEQLTLNQ
jgi:hypothetical protein